MKQFFRLAIIMFIMAGASLYAAKPAFQVLALKGAVDVESKGVTSKVQFGDILHAGQVVMLGEGDYLALIHSEGATLEFNEAGEYNISEYADNYKNKKAVATTDLVKSLLFEIRTTEKLLPDCPGNREIEIGSDLFAEQNRKSRSSFGKPGSGKKSQSARDVNIFKKIDFGIKAPRWTYLGIEPIFIDWDDVPVAGNYRFVIEDQRGEIIFSKISAISEMEFDLAKIVNSDSPSELNGKYSWHIESAKEPSIRTDDYQFRVVVEKYQEGSEFGDNYTDLMDMDDTPLRDMLLGAHHEKFGFYYDAMNYYKRAVELSGNSDQYRKYFELYMYRIKRTRTE